MQKALLWNSTSYNKIAPQMQVCSAFFGLFLVSFVAGCAVQNPPLRAVPATERLGAHVIEGKYGDSSPRVEHSTTKSQAMRKAGAQSALAPAVALGVSAAVMDSGGSGWVDKIRARSEVSEVAVLMEAVRAKVERLNSEQANSKDSEAIVTVFLLSGGIDELERGGFFGVSVSAAASLQNGQNKTVWHESAESTSTHLRRREEYEANPALYGKDFQEAAEDVARQLIEGPIRKRF